MEQERKNTRMANCCSPTAQGVRCAVPSIGGPSTPEAPGYCPVCGAHGTPIDVLTIKALLACALDVLRDTPYAFCQQQLCPVVYFSSDGTHHFAEADLRVRVHQKAPGADDVFVCYCFRHTPGTLRAAHRATGTSTVVDQIMRNIQAARCACEIRNPQGRCCLGNVRAVINAIAQEVVQSG